MVSIKCPVVNLKDITQISLDLLYVGCNRLIDLVWHSLGLSVRKIQIIAEGGMQYHIGDTSKIVIGTEKQGICPRAKGIIHEIIRIIDLAGREPDATRQCQAPIFGFEIGVCVAAERKAGKLD